MSTYSTEIPGAPGYAQAANLANRAYNTAMTRYQQQRSNTLTKYGYTRDAGGNIGVDPNNEYGAYQQMGRTEAGQVEGLGRAQASSGWDAGSGYLGAQREDLTHAQGGEQAALGQAATGDLTAIDQGEQDASFTKDSALYQAQLDAAQRAADAGQFNPGAVDNTDQPTDAQVSGDVTKPPVKGSTGAGPGGKKVAKKVTNAAHQAAKQRLINKVRRTKGGR